MFINPYRSDLGYFVGADGRDMECSSGRLGLSYTNFRSQYGSFMDQSAVGCCLYNYIKYKTGVVYPRLWQ
jgi:hypothetical protein